MIRAMSLIYTTTLLATLSTGCNSHAVKVVPVEGKILFADGKPLPKGTRLLFVPSVGNMGSATGVTDETGNFKVIHETGSSGAALGKYTIQIAAPEGEQGSFYRIVPRQYFDNGGLLTAEVKEETPLLNFVVKK